MTDETLSSKRKNMSLLSQYDNFAYPEKDVKEAIQKLKEAFDNVEVYKTPHIRKIIDKIFGDALVHSPKSHRLKDTPDGKNLANPNKGCKNVLKIVFDFFEEQKSTQYIRQDGKPYYIYSFSQKKLEELKKRLGCDNQNCKNSILMCPYCNHLGGTHSDDCRGFSSDNKSGTNSK